MKLIKEFVPVFVRSAGNYDMNAASVESGLACQDESLAHQASREEADINTMVRRFGLTGKLPLLDELPQFGEFDEVFDFHSAMNAVAAARQSFMTLPGELRARFMNDPGVFVDFCSDERNRAEAERLGLLKPAPLLPAASGAPGEPGAPAAAAAPAAAPGAPGGAPAASPGGK